MGQAGGGQVCHLRYTSSQVQFPCISLLCLTVIATVSHSQLVVLLLPDDQACLFVRNTSGYAGCMESSVSRHLVVLATPDRGVGNKTLARLTAGMQHTPEL